MRNLLGVLIFVLILCVLTPFILIRSLWTLEVDFVTNVVDNLIETVDSLIV